MVFLLIAAAIVGSAVVANFLLNVLGHSGGRIFIGATCVVVGAGGYAAGFVLEMIILARAGQLPWGNAVWPCITWSLISCSALWAGAGRRVPFVARATPFWLGGGLGVFSSFAHPRILVAATALVLGGIAYPLLTAQRRGAAGTAKRPGEPKPRRVLAPSVGPYYFGMETADASNLVAFTPAEKEALSAAVEFRNERIFHAPPAEFAGAGWDMVLGAVEGRVYKLSGLLVLEDREQRDAMWRNLTQRLRSALGTPATAAATIFAWDTEDGNVVLNRVNDGEGYAVVLTLTSRAVSGFVRVK